MPGEVEVTPIGSDIPVGYADPDADPRLQKPIPEGSPEVGRRWGPERAVALDPPAAVAACGEDDVVFVEPWPFDPGLCRPVDPGDADGACRGRPDVETGIEHDDDVRRPIRAIPARIRTVEMPNSPAKLREIVRHLPHARAPDLEGGIVDRDEADE